MTEAGIALLGVLAPLCAMSASQGDDVCRAVWMQDTGSERQARPPDPGVQSSAEAVGDAEERAVEPGLGGLQPFPKRAAAILEDAYQVLRLSLDPGKVRNFRVSQCSSCCSGETGAFRIAG